MNLRRDNPNLAQLQKAAALLESLLHRIVFVGGCVTGILITDPAAAPIRPTMDVDAITKIASYAEYTLLETEMRRFGFRESHAEGAPICRWIAEELVLDLMPTDPAILGFSNRWYPAALENSQKINIGNYQILIVNAPYFIASKLDAFHARGRNDFASHDMEDVVTVIDGRPELVGEVRTAAADLQNYIGDEFEHLLSNRRFLDALPGHTLPDAASQQRLGLIVNRMRELARKD